MQSTMLSIISMAGAVMIMMMMMMMMDAGSGASLGVIAHDVSLALLYVAPQQRLEKRGTLSQSQLE